MRHLSRTIFAALGAAGLLAVGACAAENTDDAEPAATEQATTEEATTAGDVVTVTLNDPGGSELGAVELNEVNDALQISAAISGLEPGFYGFHIHQIGACEADSAAPNNPENTGDFLSAGGHLGSDESDHPDHAGDLPQLLVKESGDAVLSFETDRLTLADLEDEDGSAIMLHSGPDNYANIPERYAPDGPDEDSLNAGDAGSRIACGVIGG